MGVAGVTSLRIHTFLMPRLSPTLSPVMAELFDRLRRAGCIVSWSIGEHETYQPDALRPEHDLYLLKSQAPAALSIAAVLHAQGAQILNPSPACAAAQDKVVATHRLAAFGVPLPRTWASGQPARLAPVVDRGPLVAKPFNGYHGTGVSFVRGANELVTLPDGDVAVLVQARLAGADDLKVYVIGDEVFAVRKQFDPTSHGRTGRPVPVGAEVRNVALRCGAAFGFGLYGVDLVETADGPVVIDVNHFPGYKGVPDAAERLCRYVLAYADGNVQLALPRLPVCRAMAGLHE